MSRQFFVFLHEFSIYNILRSCAVKKWSRAVRIGDSSADGAKCIRIKWYPTGMVRNFASLLAGHRSLLFHDKSGKQSESHPSVFIRDRVKLNCRIPRYD